MAGPPKNYASLLRSRRAYLGMSGRDGSAEVIPVCFTWAGEAIWIAFTEEVLSDQRVTFLVDRWEEDWTKLSWLMARGTATLLPEGDEEADRALDALESKYSQFLQYPHYGPILRMDVEEWTGIDALESETEEWGG